MTRPQTGDGLLIGGHFGCVTYVDPYRHRALVRVEDDPKVYSVTEMIAMAMIDNLRSRTDVEVSL